MLDSLEPKGAIVMTMPWPRASFIIENANASNERDIPLWQDARADIFDYTEMFYNTKRRHGYNNKLSSVDYAKRYFMRLTSVY